MIRDAAGGDSKQMSALPEVVRAEYPFVPRSFTLPCGARMSYLDEGPGDAPVILMVHGNPSWSFLYRSLVLALRDRFRCIVPDHLGCGLSDKPRDFDYCVRTHIENLGALVDSLGITRAHLAVHDWGGPIGLGVARRRPGFVDRLIVFNTGAFRSTHIATRIALCRLPWIGTLLMRGLNAFSRAAVHMAVTKPLSPGARAAYLWPHQNWNDRVAVNAFVRDIPLDDSHRSQGEIAAIEASLVNYRENRVLIVWAGCDWCFDDVFLAGWRKFLPAARVVRLADAGHWLIEDEPAAVAREVTMFLDS